MACRSTNHLCTRGLLFKSPPRPQPPLLLPTLLKLAGARESLLSLTVHARVSPSLPSSSTQTPLCSLMLPGLLPCAWHSAHRCPPCPFSGKPLSLPPGHPPLNTPSQPTRLPSSQPRIAPIMLHIYLCGHLTPVSPCQAATSVREGTKSVVFTDNPQCLAQSRASTFFKYIKNISFLIL